MKIRLLLLLMGVLAYFIFLPTLFLEATIYLFALRKYFTRTFPSIFDISEASDFVLNALTISLVALLFILALEIPIKLAFKLAKNPKEKKRFNIILTLTGMIGFAIGISQLGTMVSTSTIICSGHPHSWTKSKMSNIKSALISYNADLGSFPFAGTNKNLKSAYKMNIASGMGSATYTNCLFSSLIEDFAYLGLEKEKYVKLWKGPYLDGEPTDILFDLWGKPFRYFAHDKNIYIQSAGANGRFDKVEELLKSDYGEGDKDSEDDILVSVARLRRPFSDDEPKKISPNSGIFGVYY